MIAETLEEQLERLALHQQRVGDIVDHQMGEVGLAGDWAQRGEFGRSETHQIYRAGMGIRPDSSIASSGLAGMPTG